MRTVLYTCPFVPAEWIAAHGLRPSRIVPRAKWDAPAVAVRTGMCPYARAFINEACSAAEDQAVIVTTACDQMRRAAELIAQRGRAAVFLMNVPATWQSPLAHRTYRQELDRLGRFLVELGGQARSRERLAGIMEDFETQREALRSARGLLEPGRYSRAIAEFHRSGKLEVAEDGPGDGGGVPLALLGGPLMRDDFEIFDLIRRAGGAIVLDATETGELTLPGRFDRRRLREDPLGEAADAYFGTIPAAFRRPNSELYRWLARLLPERGAAGIILRRYLWCDMWHAEAGRLREWGLLPVLDVQVSEEEDPSGRLEGRIRAFVEMLQ